MSETGGDSGELRDETLKPFMIGGIEVVPLSSAEEERTGFSCGIRHPDDPERIVYYTRSEVDAFIRGAEAGEFDDLGATE